MRVWTLLLQILFDLLELFEVGDDLGGDDAGGRGGWRCLQGRPLLATKGREREHQRARAGGSSGWAL